PVGADDRATPLPRYRLQVGQELIYRSEDDFKYETGAFHYETTWHVWVVRDNPDGGWRLLIRAGMTMSQSSASQPAKTSYLTALVKGLIETFSSATTVSRPVDVTFAYCDFSPDGRVVENDSFGYRMSPHRLLPRLPKDQAEFHEG